MLPSWLAEWQASPWLPAILALGAFADAFLPTSVFVLGELFFIATGYIVGLTAQWWLIPLIWSMALLGDLSSYIIGQRYGETIIRRFIHKGAKRRLNYLRARRLMQQKGGITIFTARLTGPIAKFMPFLAGTMSTPFNTVVWASLFGVMVGTAQFFLIGWVLSQELNYREVLQQFIQQNPSLTAIITLCGLICLGWGLKKLYKR